MHYKPSPSLRKEPPKTAQGASAAKRRRRLPVNGRISIVTYLYAYPRERVTAGEDCFRRPLEEARSPCLSLERRCKGYQR